MEFNHIDADRISQLPEHIIHNILCFLPTRDLVRLSILSKVWQGLVACFPISDFSYYDSCTITKVDITLGFLNFVYSSLLRQCRRYRCIPKFKLSLTGTRYHMPTSPEYKQLINLIDRSVLLSQQFGVRELSLHLYGGIGYKLSKAEGFLSTPSLRELSLERVNISDEIISGINWCGLREFSLKRVKISDQIIENLIFICPLIEKFSLINCDRIKQLRLVGFTKLKKVKVTKVQKVEIDALSLQAFSSCWYRQIPPDVDLTLCRNLEVLKIKNYSIPGGIIHDINSKFPVLKHLVLEGRVDGIRRINISSPQLETLHLSADYREAVINAPRLQSFEHGLRRCIPSSLSLNQTSLKNVSLKLPIEHIIYHYRNGDDFLNSVMQYLRNFNRINRVTWYVSRAACSQIPEVVSNVSLSSVPALLHIELLKLKLDFAAYGDKVEEEISQALVDILFGFCHPESLLLVYGWEDNHHFIQILCKKLIQRFADDLLQGIFKIELIERNGVRKVLTYDAFDSPLTLAPKDKIRFDFR